MLEQLGLGVVLTMEDDFTPKANSALDSFDRLQAGAEGMVSNIQKNMLQMRNIMMTGFTFEQLGESLENFGSRLNQSFEDMYKGTAKAGAQWETLRNTMRTFYKEQTDLTMQKGLELASRTPFEVEDVMDSLRSLKAMKMDALKIYDELDSAGKKYKKTFLEYVGDLGAFNPQQGMQGAMTAVRNLLGGSKKSLDSRFDVNSEFILGEKWSQNPMKMQEQFVKFIDKLAPNMMKNLEGTFDQLVSNMEDKWTMFKISVAEGGAFEPMKKTLEYVSQRFDEIYDSGKMKQIAGVVGQALGALWKPIDFLVKRITDLVILFGRFSEAHPQIAKIILGIMGVIGVTVTLTGVLLKLCGGILMAISSISILILNFRLMQLTGVSLTSSLSGLGVAFAGLISKLTVAGLVGAGLFYAWERDIGGLQSKFNGLFSSITTGWALAKEAMRKGANLDGAMKDYQFKAKIKLPPLTKIFAGKFLKILAISKAFWQVITGHFDNGVMHFSKKDWDLYEKAGIAGLVRGMVYAKDKIDRFFEGFKQGLTVVGGLLKEFALMVWKPIKVVIDAIDKNINKYPNGLMARLFVGKGGVALSTAQKHAEVAHRLGKAVGLAVGSIVAMKAIKGITPIILSPFTKLYKKLGQIGTKALDVKSKLAGIASGGVIGIVKNTVSKSKDSGYYNNVSKDLKAHIASYDRTSKYQEGRSFRDGKFQSLSGKNVDDTYYNYFLKQKLGEGQLQVKRRSKLGKLFLGEDYYRKNADGSRDKLGRFGGLLRMNKDDRNIENRATSLFANGQMPRDNTIDGITHRPVIGDSVGKLRNLKGSEALLGQHQLNQDIIKSSARQVTGLSNSQFNRFSSVRQKEMSKDYQNLSNKAWDKSINKDEMGRLRKYNELGFDSNNVGAFDKANFNNPLASSLYADVRKQRASNALNNSSFYAQAKRNAGATSLNQTVFADNKQNGLSRMLFGQKLYTVNEGANGQYTKNQVGRRGGILRRSSTDMAYRPKTSFRSKMEQGFLSTPLGMSTQYVGNSIRNSALGNIAGATRRRASSFVGGVGRVKSKATSLIGRPMSKVGAWYDKQREKVGLAPRVPKAERGGFRGLVKSTGSALFGSKIRNSEGQVVGRRRGLVSRVGGGAVKATRGAFRGVGALGGLAMRAMPLMALGGFAFKGISAKGAGADRKKLGLDPKASNFQVGLKMLQKDMSKLNFTKMWAKFKKEGSGSFKIIKKIAVDAFRGLKPLLPKIMGEAFKGIKGLAKLAWTWIKTDGITLIGQLATSLMGLMGKAWEWVSANGGKVMGKLVQFVIGTVVPKLIAGVIKFGTFVITHIPTMLRGLMGIALGIFKGIFNGVVSIFKGIGSAIWNAIKSAFKGIGSVILSALAVPIRNVPLVGNTVADFLHLPAHHGGLWMSNDEHMAVIKKDETVLPPDKSRQLSNLLSKGERLGGRGTSRGSSHTDNSITIKEVKINVQAGKLSQSDARKQALMILSELKKIKREKQVRSYEDITTTGLNL